MHDTKELKRQWEAARQRTRDAAEAERAAREAYFDSNIKDKLDEFAKLGIKPGNKVIAVRKGMFGQPTRRVAALISVTRPRWGLNPEVNLADLKKDGTPSKAKRHISFDSLEPFEGSPEQAAEREA